MGSQVDRFSRRGFLRSGAASAAGIAAGVGTAVEASPSLAPTQQGLDPAKLARLYEVLLPQRVGPSERAETVRTFLIWVRGYQPDAEMDHGYGFTRERFTAPTPVPGYVNDLAALEAGAGGDLATLDTDRLRELVRAAIESAGRGIDDIPDRPDSSHLCIALLAHYYRGAAATDRCYGVAIRRETCRGLFTDVDSLAAADGAGR